MDKMNSTSDEHKKDAPDKVSIAIITVSNTRDVVDDVSGNVIKEAAKEHNIVKHIVIKDNMALIRNEIRETARAICQKTRGTDAEPLGVEINQLARDLDSDYPDVDKDNISYILRKFAANLPPEDKNHIQRQTEQIDVEKTPINILNRVSNVLACILPSIDNMKAPTNIEISESRVQIATGDGNTQKIDTASKSEENPWYQDAKTLIALGMLLIAAIGLLIKVF